MLDTPPYYDPKKPYDDNYKDGPFGAFADNQIYEQTNESTSDFLGQKVYLPFGIPAGPIINANYCKAAFEKGFDIVVYKTVRSATFPCHPFPNILSVKIDGDLTLEKAKEKLIACDVYKQPLSITNSFGVPSKDLSVWQEDVKKAISYAGKGQVLVLSFMGTVKPNQTQEEFIADYVSAAKLSMETGAKILEVNLSCPNIGNEGLVCYNLDMTERVCKAIRNVIGNIPLILKVGYYKEDADLEKLMVIVTKYAKAIASINTIQAEIINEEGEQALPGLTRARSGVCGTSIKWAGIEMVKRLKNIRDRVGANIALIGVGGVMNEDDYFEYKSAGADCVMSATGSMWNPHLAQKIKQKISTT